MSQFEQGANIKFCQKLGKSPSKMFNIMKQDTAKKVWGTVSFKMQQCFA
jgi:hypothetical protein